MEIWYVINVVNVERSDSVSQSSDSVSRISAAKSNVTDVDAYSEYVGVVKSVVVSVKLYGIWRCGMC